MRGRPVNPFDLTLQELELPKTIDDHRRTVHRISICVKVGTAFVANCSMSDEAIDATIKRLKTDLDMIGIKAKRLARKTGSP
jgi:hypothetical protein